MSPTIPTADRLMNQFEQTPARLKDRVFSLGVILGSLVLAGFIFYICDPDFKIPEFLRAPAPPPKGSFFLEYRNPDQIPGETMFYLIGIASPIFLFHLLTNKKWGYVLGCSLVVAPILVLIIMFLSYGSILGALYCLIFALFFIFISIGLYMLSRRFAILRTHGVAGLLKSPTNPYERA